MHRGNDLGRSRIGFDLLAQLGDMLIEARSQLQERRLRLLHLLNPGEEGFHDPTAGLNLSYALGNRKAKARHRSALASRNQAQLAIDNLKHLVRLDVRLAANELERARQQISASTTTRGLQEKTLTAEQERFEVGASTTLLVAQAQRDLLASQIAEVEAIINYRIALVNLYLAEGSLLERRGIQVGN